MHTIEVDEDVMNALKRKAEPFVDTPNSVLRRVLNVDGAGVRGGTGAHKHSRAVRHHRQGSSGGGTEKNQRVPMGSILPEQEYIEPLLRVLLERGGRAPAREVIEDVGRRLAGRLTPLDKEPVASGGVRWQNRVQFARLKLVERGLLKRESPRGLWEITEQGMAQVQPEKAADHAGTSARA